MQRTNSRNAVSRLLPAKSLGATICIRRDAPKANAPTDVQSAARRELHGNDEPVTMGKRIVVMPVARQKTR